MMTNEKFMRNILFSSICASFLAITAISTATADKEKTSPSALSASLVPLGGTGGD